MSNPTIVPDTTVAFTAEEGLGLVNTLLPFLESMVPAMAGGPVGLGISAAVALAPMVIRLISRLSASGAIDAPTQRALLERVADIYGGFGSPTWTTPVIPLPPGLSLPPNTTP